MAAYSLLGLLLWLGADVEASYRKFGFLNHDICSEDKKLKTLNLGAGAAIFTLDNFDTDLKDKFTLCQLKIIADDGYGLMVYVEEMYLRKESSHSGPKCLDYIQFGIDDLIPFITLAKSDRKCGNETGYAYDDPDGNLLVWLGMGPSYPSVSRESVKLTRLSIIVTAYLKGDRRVDMANYRPCGDTGKKPRWIRKEYFCDKRINCALDEDPADERSTICRHLLSGDGGMAGPSDQLPEWQPQLNLVSITLILVSAFVILVLGLLLVARMRRARWCCFSVMRRAGMESCELPERSVGPTRHHMHPPATGGNSGGGLLLLDTMASHEVDNVYMPLTMHIEPRRDEPLQHRHLSGEQVVRGTTPDTEPPPAYHDLFPAGYKFTQDKIEEEGEETEEGADASQGLVLFSLLKEADETRAAQDTAEVTVAPEATIGTEEDSEASRSANQPDMATGGEASHPVNR